MKPLCIGLKAGERIFVNGAVLRADRKVTLEFLNAVDFLLEQHILRAEETHTPLRQLYFIAQTMLMEPAGRAALGPAFEEHWGRLVGAVESPALKAGLHDAATQLRAGRLFETLRTLRALFPAEAAILARADAAPATSTAA